MKLNNGPRQVCIACVMDTSDPDISFDGNGLCSHCRNAAVHFPRIRLAEDESKRRLDAIAQRVKSVSARQPYDAIIGLSGGVDSSYVALLAKRMGLRVLAVHFDNGWNSEIATANIERIVNSCGFDLLTYVIDWPEFRDLQRSFLRAGVVDVEMITDHAISAVIFKLARQRRIRVILSGTNYATEHGMPRAWVWNKQDLTNILAIQRQFGTMRLRSFPRMGLIRASYNRFVAGRLSFVEPLDHANYRKGHAMAELEREFGWRYYGGKHYESIFTKFYQAYILPTRGGIDKRRPHLSALIRNGEITREQSLAELDQPLYEPEQLRHDKSFVLKKLGIPEEEFDELMRQPLVPHQHYASDLRWRVMLKRLATKAPLALFRRRISQQD